jgi:hypothetical protein
MVTAEAGVVVETSAVVMYVADVVVVGMVGDHPVNVPPNVSVLIVYVTALAPGTVLVVLLYSSTRTCDVPFVPGIPFTASSTGVLHVPPAMGDAPCPLMVVLVEYVATVDVAGWVVSHVTPPPVGTTFAPLLKLYDPVPVVGAVGVVPPW